MNRKIKIAFMLLLLSFMNNCIKEYELPNHYKGYALLQTEGTGIDGVVLFTFYPLPNINDELMKDKIDYNRFLTNKCITIITTPIEPYLEVRQELFDKKWRKTDDIILVKVNYEIVETYWKQYTYIDTKEIKINKKKTLLKTLFSTVKLIVQVNFYINLPIWKFSKK